MPLDLRSVELVEGLLGRRFVECEHVARVLGQRPRLVPDTFAFACGQHDDRIRRQQVAEVPFVHLQAVGQRQHGVVSGENLLFQQRVVGTRRGGVDLDLQRVDVVLQFADVLGLAAREQVGVGASHGESRHGDHLFLQVEGVVAQGAFREPLAVAGLLVHLAVEKRHEQEPLVVRQADVARVGHDGVHVAVGDAVVVDQHVVQQVRVGFLVAHADRHVVDAVEEEPVLEFEGLFLLPDVVERAE